jgi:signal transduction histidine kinase
MKKYNMELKKRSSLMFTSSSKRLYSIVFIVAVIAISYFLFFHLQYNIEANTKDRLIAQEAKNQMASTKKIAVHIASDLNSIVVALHGLANSIYIQQGELSSGKAEDLLRETYFQINTITVIDRLFIVDKNNTAAAFIVPKGQTEPFFGSDNISIEDIVHNARTKLVPAFSNGFSGLDGKYRIAITYPILNRDTQEYIGCIVALIPTTQFFEHYGNVNDPNSEYLTSYDRNGTYLSNPSQDLIGVNILDHKIQQLIKYNNNFNDLISKVILNGQASQVIYNYGMGENLATGYPVLEQGKPTYFVFVDTSTSDIYSQINGVLFLERIEMFSLLAGTTAAITFLIVFLLKWSSSLDREVKRRTTELEKINSQLTSVNKQLEDNDKIQKQFINIAAHELRTPLQPIISYSALALKGQVNKNEAINTILKHADRLNTLTSDLLEIIRIENGKLPYKREKTDINQLILEIVSEKAKENDSILINTRDSNNSNKPREVAEGHRIISYEQPGVQAQITIELDLEPEVQEMYVDRTRIAEVLSRIIDNAIDFTNKDKIKIETHYLLNNRKGTSTNDITEIKISDNGPGIPEDVLPSLFGKFVTKSILTKGSKWGSGLGLVISKAIIIAHKGEITAHNNDYGGATITIVLPNDTTNSNIA